jgi:serine/threonine-protein kinase
MQTLGKYQLVAEIARGGMGVVYLAVASGPGGFSKLFVVKELKAELVDEPTFLDMFLEEARLAARLSHPNIVTTYEVGLDGRRPFIVMDYLDGESLGRILRKRSPKLTTAMHLRLLCHALDGLEYAHTLEELDGTTASVIHRDMSPQNVFVTYDGQVKIVDFGIAKAADTSIETMAGIMKGKPGYMSPEQLSGDVDARSDVFSVGVMIWEAVAGRRMWPNKGPVEILTALIKGEIPKLGDVVPGAPEALREICDRATAKEPDHRFSSARELHDALDAYLESANERMTVRQIAAIIASLFEEQRRSVRAMLETCIAQAKAGAASTKLPSLAPPSLDTGTPRPTSDASARLPSGTPVSQTTAAAAMLEPATAPFGEMSEMTAPRRTALVVVALGIVAAIAILLLLRAGENANGARPSVAVKGPPSAPLEGPRAATPPPAPPAPPAPPSAPPPLPAPASASAPPPIASATSPPVTPRPRFVYVAPPPVAPPPAPASAQASPTDCNPPFYFEGTKKVFKPACL